MNVNNMVLESTKRGYSGYKMSNVGSGAGKTIGGIAASPLGLAGQIPGMIAGHYIGKDMPKNPNAPIDEKRAGHRFSVIQDKMNSLKQVKAAGLGAAAGAGIGTVAGGLKRGHFDPDDAKRGAAIGGAVGGVGAAAGSQIKAGYKAAKKLGYGKVGRIAAATLGGVAGLATPKTLKDAHKKLASKKGK